MPKLFEKPSLNCFPAAEPDGAAEPDAAGPEPAAEGAAADGAAADGAAALGAVDAPELEQAAAKMAIAANPATPRPRFEPMIIPVPPRCTRRADMVAPQNHRLLLRSHGSDVVVPPPACCPCSPLSSDGASDPVSVIAIGGVEQLLRSLRADDRCPRDDRRHRAALDEQLCGAHFNRVDDGHRRKRRARTDWRVEALELDEGVRMRRAEVDDEVGLVEESRLG